MTERKRISQRNLTEKRPKAERPVKKVVQRRKEEVPEPVVSKPVYNIVAPEKRVYRKHTNTRVYPEETVQTVSGRVYCGIPDVDTFKELADRLSKLPNIKVLKVVPVFDQQTNIFKRFGYISVASTSKKTLAGSGLVESPPEDPVALIVRTHNNVQYRGFTLKVEAAKEPLPLHYAKHPSHASSASATAAAPAPFSAQTIRLRPRRGAKAVEAKTTPLAYSLDDEAREISFLLGLSEEKRQRVIQRAVRRSAARRMSLADAEVPVTDHSEAAKLAAISGLSLEEAARLQRVSGANSSAIWAPLPDPESARLRASQQVLAEASMDLESLYERVLKYHYGHVRSARDGYANRFGPDRVPGSLDADEQRDVDALRADLIRERERIMQIRSLLTDFSGLSAEERLLFLGLPESDVEDTLSDEDTDDVREIDDRMDLVSSSESDSISESESDDEESDEAKKKKILALLGMQGPPALPNNAPLLQHSSDDDMDQGDSESEASCSDVGLETEELTSSVDNAYGDTVIPNVASFGALFGDAPAATKTLVVVSSSEDEEEDVSEEDSFSVSNGEGDEGSDDTGQQDKEKDSAKSSGKRSREDDSSSLSGSSSEAPFSGSNEHSSNRGKRHTGKDGDDDDDDDDDKKRSSKKFKTVESSDSSSDSDSDSESDSDTSTTSTTSSSSDSDAEKNASVHQKQEKQEKQEKKKKLSTQEQNLRREITSEASSSLGILASLFGDSSLTTVENKSFSVDQTEKKAMKKTKKDSALKAVETTAPPTVPTTSKVVVNVGWRNMLYGDQATEAARAKATPVALGAPAASTEKNKGALSKFDGVVRAHHDGSFTFGQMFSEMVGEGDADVDVESKKESGEQKSGFSFGFDLGKDDSTTSGQGSSAKKTTFAPSAPATAGSGHKINREQKPIVEKHNAQLASQQAYRSIKTTINQSAALLSSASTFGGASLIQNNFKNPKAQTKQINNFKSDYKLKMKHSARDRHNFRK